MKKIIAVVIAMTLALMLPALALAEEVLTIDWVATEAEFADAGIEGDFYSLGELGLKIWVPNVMKAVEIGDQESGVVGAFATDDGEYSILVQYIEGTEGMDMDTFIADLTDSGATEVERVILNGLDAVSYSMADTDANIMAFLAESGEVVQFICVPASDKDFEVMCALIMASIQAE